MAFVFLGVVAFFNFAVILAKLNRKRFSDAFFDVVSLVLLNAMFSGSFGGAVIATVASAFMSLYLFFTPLKFLAKFKKNTEELKTKFTSKPNGEPKESTSKADVTKLMNSNLDELLAQYNL